MVDIPLLLTLIRYGNSDTAFAAKEEILEYLNSLESITEQELALLEIDREMIALQKLRAKEEEKYVEAYGQLARIDTMMKKLEEKRAWKTGS